LRTSSICANDDKLFATSWSAISAITRSIDWRQSDDAAKYETGIDVVATLN
jgi:hypothetical protein